MPEKPAYQPPSQMLRVPSPLVDAVRALSRLHRQGHTVQVLEELQSVIARIGDKVDRTHSPSHAALPQMLEILQAMQQQMDRMDTRLARLEAGQGQRTSRRKYPAISQPVQLDALPAENLAKRLGVDVKSLDAQRESNSPREFERWSRHRDPSHLGWRYQDSDRLYYAVRQ